MLIRIPISPMPKASWQKLAAKPLAWGSPQATAVLGGDGGLIASPERRFCSSLARLGDADLSLPHEALASSTVQRPQTHQAREKQARALGWRGRAAGPGPLGEGAAARLVGCRPPDSMFLGSQDPANSQGNALLAWK